MSCSYIPRWGLAMLVTVRHPFWGMAEDVRQNRASFFDVQSEGYYTEYELGFPDSTYTTTNLLARGK